MAKVTEVTLGELGEPDEDGNVAVEVGYTLDFAAGEVGRSFKVRVELLGWDPLVERRPLYVFRFRRRGPAKFGWFTPTYLVYKPDQAGPVTLTAKAAVPRSVLDEDPGFRKEPMKGHPRIDTLVRREDEVFARVTLTWGKNPKMQLTSSAQSTVQVISV